MDRLDHPEKFKDISDLATPDSQNEEAPAASPVTDNSEVLPVPNAPPDSDEDELEPYYGRFYQFPVAVMNVPIFRELTHTSMLLYMRMLDRLQLSISNNWRDDNGRPFIFYPLPQIEKDLNCTRPTATKAKRDLVNAGLISLVDQSSAKAQMIYVRNVMYRSSSKSARKEKEAEPQSHEVS